MRLWHQSLIHYLDDKRLLGQHRECCALRGKGWGRKHSTVDYVFNYEPAYLYCYHMLVLHEMHGYRHFNVDSRWYNRLYRGHHMPKYNSLLAAGSYYYSNNDVTIYNEHNDKYLRECLLNLKAKGAELVNGKTIEEMLIELDLKEHLVQ